MKSLTMATVSSLGLSIVLTCAAETAAANVNDTFSGPGVCGALSYDPDCPGSDCSHQTNTCHFVFHAEHAERVYFHCFYYKDANYHCGQNGANQYYEIIMYYGTPATFTLRTVTNLGSCTLVLTYGPHGTPPSFGSLPTSLMKSDFKSMKLTTPTSSGTYDLNSLTPVASTACDNAHACSCTVPRIECPPQLVYVPVYYFPPAPCVPTVRQPLLARLGSCRLVRRCR
jgi:hypothetical protein